MNLPETVEQTPNTRVSDQTRGRDSLGQSGEQLLPMMKCGKVQVDKQTLPVERFTGGGVAVQAASAIATASSLARWSLSRA